MAVHKMGHLITKKTMFLKIGIISYKYVLFFRFILNFDICQNKNR